jgi:D-tyrosyl-tRNA(Tyr) deacylase
VRAVVQRVSRAEVRVGDEVVGRIAHGLLVYAGVSAEDSPDDAVFLADKIRHLRIFSDQQGKLNLDVLQAGAAVLVISNFTLLADARKGRRPEFTRAASPEAAKTLYELLCENLATAGIPVQRGRFREMMEVEAVNSGPINILLDSKRLF